MRAMSEGRRGSNVSQAGPGWCVEQFQAMWEAMCDTDAFRGMQLQPPMEQPGPKTGGRPSGAGRSFLERDNKRKSITIWSRTRRQGWLCLVLLWWKFGTFRLVELGVEELTRTEVSSTHQGQETQERDRKTLGRQEEMVTYLCK